MEHADHVRLIQKGISQKKGVWADLGSGDGAFTLALADITLSKTEIYSVDLDERRLHIQHQSFRELFPQAVIRFLLTDFTKELPFSQLDGILMANSLHFVEDKVQLLMQLKKYVKKTGRFIVVEYNADRGNTWVPYPISFGSLAGLTKKSGFSKPRLIGKIASTFLEEIYAAMFTLR